MFIKLERKRIIYLFLITIWIGTYVYGQEIPILKITFSYETKKFLNTYSQMIPPLSKTPREVRTELKKRYNEAWGANKSQWPECMRKVFENLKKFDEIIIEFEIKGEYRRPLYKGDLDADGYFDCAPVMQIINVYADKFHVTQKKIDSLNLDKTRINPDMWFDTSGVLLHEMIHMALFRNQAMKEVYDNGTLVDSWQDETRPEDCTTLAINKGIRYYDLKGQNPEKNKADDCDCKNKSKSNAKTSGLSGSSEYSPGNDHGDECFSFAQGNMSQCSQDSNVIIYMKGYFEEMNSLIGGVLFDGVEPAQRLLQISPLLVIPSGGLYGKENDSVLKTRRVAGIGIAAWLIEFPKRFKINYRKKR